MDNHPQGRSYDARFWQEYENNLLAQRVNPKHIRWYKRWCQQFVKFLGTQPLENCRPEHVSAFLDNLQRNEMIKDWQYSQARTALWYLYRDQLQLSWTRGEPPEVHRPERRCRAELSPAHQAAWERKLP